METVTELSEKLSVCSGAERIRYPHVTLDREVAAATASIIAPSMSYSALPERDDAFQLEPGGMYRISYAVGSHQHRRLTRSLVVFEGRSQRRMWGGQAVSCLDFLRPQGRALSLLSTQLVDVRPASLNERGQLILNDDPAQPKRRLSRRQSLVEQPGF
jgi:hypothetical protein